MMRKGLSLYKEALDCIAAFEQARAMRRPRMKAPENQSVAFYHCVSRVVNREFLLGDGEKEKLVGLMRSYERLYGVRVAAYCMMSNHFHVLVEVPCRPQDGDLPDDAGLVKMVRQCLGKAAADELEWRLGHYRGIGAGDAAAELREKWFSRMWDISSFMKSFKQRFTQWFNGRHGRIGTLWESRYRSVLVEGAGPALRSMAAYIDLNPVRAGICEDPADYPWCGYAAAVGGDRQARRAVRWLSALRADAVEGTPLPQWKRAARTWRCFLFGIPESEAEQAEEMAKGENAAVFRRRISRKKALEVLERGGRLPLADFLRCRVRYFSDGAAVGSREFVESVFKASRGQFGPNRRAGAHPVRGLEPGGDGAPRLFNMRQLQERVFG